MHLSRSDAKLVRLTLDGNLEAFETLVLRHQRAVHAVALAGVGSFSHAEDAEDIVQDAFLQAFRSLADLREPKMFRPWLLAITRRLAIKWLARRREARLETEPFAQDSSPVMETEDFREYLWRRVRDLPLELRETVFLYYFEAGSVGEVAKAVGISKSGVKKRLRRGRAQLRDTLWQELARCLGDVVPSKNQWVKRGKRLSLLVTTSIPLSFALRAEGASLPHSSLWSERGVDLAARQVSTAVQVGVMTMAGKKLVLAVVIALVLFGFGGWALKEVLLPPDPPQSRPVAASHVSTSPPPKETATVANPEPLAVIQGTETITVHVEWAESGEPVSGAKVTLQRSDEDAVFKEITCDEHGDVSVVYPSDWKGAWISVRHETTAESARSLALPMDSAVSIELNPVYVITGAVTDSSSDEPIRGAEIRPGSDHAQTAFADDAGVYELPRNGKGEQSFTVWADGYAQQSVKVHVTEMGNTRRDVTLNLLEEILVTVVDSESSPVEGAEVKASLVEGSGHYGDRIVTNTLGQAKVWRDRTLTRQFPRFGVTKPGFSVSTISDLKQNIQGEWTVQIVLERLDVRAIGGQITDEQGRPLAGVLIGWNDGSMRWGPNGVERKSHTVSDADGFYLLTLRHRKNQFDFVAHGLGWAPTIHEDITIGTTDQPAKLDFTMKRGHWLRGQVVDEDGIPIKRVAVKAFPTESSYASSDILPGVPHEIRTDEDGRFSLADLPGPKVFVDFRARGYSSVGRSPVVVDTGLRQTLFRPGIVRGRVVDEETEKPVAHFTVKIKNGPSWGDGRSTVGESFSSSDGSFVLSDLYRGDEPSLFTLTLEATGYASALLKNAEALPIGEAPVHLVELARSRELEGYVLDAVSREPISGASISYGIFDRADVHWNEMFLRGMHNHQYCTTNEAGSFRVIEGEAGTFFVRAPGYCRRILRPEDRPEAIGKNEPLLIELRRGETLGVTYLKDGEPVIGKRVSLIRLEPKIPLGGRPSRERYEGVKTDRDGKSSWLNLSAGTYFVEIEKSTPKRRKVTWIRSRVEVQMGAAVNMIVGNELGTLTLRGTLSDRTGMPHDGISMTLYPLFDWAVDELNTYVQDGTFLAMGLREGRYRIEAFSWKDPQRRLFELPTVELSTDHEVAWRVEVPSDE